MKDKFNMMVVKGQLYKTNRARICEEMPSIKLRGKFWFLSKALDDGWEYLGYFDTLKSLKSYINEAQ